jgi:hypothetical protein
MNGKHRMTCKLAIVSFISFLSSAMANDAFMQDFGHWESKNTQSQKIELCIKENGSHFSHFANGTETKFLIEEKNIVQVEDIVVLKIAPFSSSIFKATFQYSKNNEANWGVFYRMHGERFGSVHALELRKSKDDCTFDIEDTYGFKTRKKLGL